VNELETYARTLAEQNGLDPEFVARIAQTESNWNPKAVSKAGAMGVMQLMPGTAREMGVDPTDPLDNIRGGVTYLAKLHKQFGGDPTLVAAAYNAGPGAVQKAGGVPNFPETQKYVQKVVGDAPVDESRLVAQEQPVDESRLVAHGTGEQVGPGQAALIAGGRGLDRLAAGLRQIVPEGVRNAVDALGNKMGMAAPPSIDPAVQAANTAAYKNVQEQQPGATLAGELPQMMAAKTPLGMAAMGALEYGTPAERALNAGSGYLGAKAGQYIGSAVSRAITPFRGMGEQVTGATKALLDKYGISGLPGQITGSAPLQWIESTLAKLPGGGAIRSAAAAQQQGLNRATMEAMGGSGSAVTPEAVNAAKAGFGKTFDAAAAPVTVQIDRAAATDLMKVEGDYYKNLSPDQRGIVRQYVDDILSHSETGMPGDVYQKARSRIAARAASTNDSELKNALTAVYKSLDNAFDRSAGEDAASAMNTARGQYRVAKTLEPLANVTGDVSPARLATAAKNLPGDLAQLGQTMKGLPDSGTAQREFYQRLMTASPGALVGAGVGIGSGDPTEGLKWGAATMASQFAGPWLASQLLTRAPTRAYLTNGLLSPAAERALKRLGVSGGGLLGLEATR
jgi:hypothetical protein